MWESTVLVVGMTELAWESPDLQQGQGQWGSRVLEYPGTAGSLRRAENGVRDSWAVGSILPGTEGAAGEGSSGLSQQ